VRAGTIRAFWAGGPPADIHGAEGGSAIGSPSWNASLWVRDIVVSWSMWNWSWSESLDPGKGWITENLVGLDDPEACFHWELQLTDCHGLSG
jgi:hypothetical protein